MRLVVSLVLLVRRLLGKVSIKKKKVDQRSIVFSPRECGMLFFQVGTSIQLFILFLVVSDHSSFNYASVAVDYGIFSCFLML